MSSSRLSPVNPVSPASIRWVSWPLRDAPHKAILVVLGLVAVGLVVYFITGWVHMAFLAAAALALSMWRFFVPIHFELDWRGVHQTVVRERRIPWQAIGRHEIAPGGILFFPDKDASPLAYGRALFVPWGRLQNDVQEFVRRYLGDPDSMPES